MTGSGGGSGQNNIDFRRMFSGDCFDFDRLSVSSLGGLVLKREQKRRLFLIHGKIFHLVDPFQHRDIFSKELLGEFCQLQPIQRS